MRSTTRHPLLMLAALCLWPLAAAADLTLSVTPRFSPDELIKQMTPLANQLSEALGERVELLLMSDFNEMEQGMKSGRIDIAYVNPIIYPRASKAHEAVALASRGTGGAKVRGLLITRADSQIVSTEDLKGRSATIVSYESVGGYLSQKVALEKQGVSTDKDMRLQLSKDNKQENVILSVYMGDVDAGFINEDALKSADKYVPPSQIRIMLRGEWMPGWAISVKRSLPPAVKDKVRETVLGLPANDPVLKALKVDGFVAGSDSDYDVYREALKLPKSAP